MSEPWKRARKSIVERKKWSTYSLMTYFPSLSYCFMRRQRRYLATLSTSLSLFTNCRPKQNKSVRFDKLLLLLLLLLWLPNECRTWVWKVRVLGEERQSVIECVYFAWGKERECVCVCVWERERESERERGRVCVCTTELKTNAWMNVLFTNAKTHNKLRHVTERTQYRKKHSDKEN